jgi:hypothetical protein
MRTAAGYIWTDYKTNAQISNELKITPILDKLLEYKRNCKQHVNTGLFISPSETSELSCTTTKTDIAERNISIGAESLQVFLFTRFHCALTSFIVRGQS